MRGVRERWRAGPPEFLIRIGGGIALAGNVGWIALTLVTEGGGGSPSTLAAAVAGIVLSIAPIVLLATRRARTAKHFALVGGVATAIVLLTWPGVIGGGLALAGSVWGIMATYGGMPDTPRR